MEEDNFVAIEGHVEVVERDNDSAFVYDMMRMAAVKTKDEPMARRMMRKMMKTKKEEEPQ